MDLLLWDGSFSAISLFGTSEFLEGDTKNIACSLQRIAKFIKQRPIGNKSEKDIPQINQFGHTTWELISAIYKSGWDKIMANANSNSSRQCISLQFNRNKNTINKIINGKSVTISRIPPPVPPRPNAKVLKKSKYHNKEKSVAQATKGNIKDIIKIKETFPKLPYNKIMEINKIANNNSTHKGKKINMTSKGPS